MAGSEKYQWQGRRKGRVAMEDDALRCGYLYLDHLIEIQAVDQFDMEASFVHKFNRMLFKILNRIGTIDVVNRNQEIEQDTGGSGDDDEEDDDKEENEEDKAPSIKSEYRRAKQTLVRKFVLCLYCLFTCHILISLYYQYSYDLNLVGLITLHDSSFNTSFHLNSTNLVASFQAGQGRDPTELELKLLNRMQASKLVLGAIGAPESRKSIASELANICIVFLAFIIVGISHLYYRYVAPVDLYHFREQLDYASERELAERLVAQTVASYCKSDRLFEELHSELNSGDSKCHLYRFLSHGHVETGPMLHMMLTSGALMPLNRSLSWTRMRDLMLFSYELFMILFMILLYSMLLLASTDAQTKLNMVEISNQGLIFQVSLIACSIGVSFFIVPIDQIFLVNKLIKLIEQCIQVNSAELKRYIDACKFARRRQQQMKPASNVNKCKQQQQQQQQQQQDQGESLKSSIEAVKSLQRGGTSSLHSTSALDFALSCQLQEPTLKMNANLLFTLMHFKIFVRQLKPIIRTLNPGGIFNYASLLLFPIVVKVHMPYLELFQAHDNYRLILAAICASILLPVNAGILHVCHLNARCVHLYKSLSSLIAHIIETETQHARSFYNSHAVLSILKELRDPNRFTDQFITRYAGLSGTYSTLVRAHFWWGLIMISILIGTQSNKGGMLDSLFDDPFGAFSIKE